jgi:flagellar protein FliO/FliZ
MDSPVVAILWFVAIVAAIPLALWLLKRSPMGRMAQGQGARLVGGLPLSGSQRLVIVEVGQGDDRRWLVLGVAPSSINLLHTMPPQPEAVSALEAGAPSLRSGRLQPWA